MSAEKPLLIGVDLGTTNTKALVIDGSASVLGAAALPIATTSDDPGVVEQDPEEMFGNLVFCVTEALSQAGCGPGDVIGLGVSSQTETLVVWHGGSGAPVMPAMVWQCRRGQDEIEPLRTPENEVLIRRRTGLDLDPTFTAAKLKWLTINRPEIAEGLASGTYLWGTVDTWIRFRLAGGNAYATEPGNASRTMLFNIEQGGWARDIVDLFGLNLKLFPRVTPSAGSFGVTSPGLFTSDIPVTAFLGDQQASLFGHGCFAKGEGKATFGTGAFAWVNAGDTLDPAAPPGIIRTIAWFLGNRPVYAREGFVMYAGAALDWVVSNFGFANASEAVAAASAVGSSNGVTLVPAFQGLAAPWWQPGTRAVLAGMTKATAREHIAHAALESVCWQLKLLMEEMKINGTLSVDGGLSRSPYFLKMQANALGKPLARAEIEDTSALGAALMAGLGAGLWKSPEQLRPLIRHAEPVEPDVETMQPGMALWRRWVDAAIAMERPAAQ